MLEPEIAALHDGAVDHLGVFVEPSLVLLRTSRIDHESESAILRQAGFLPRLIALTYRESEPE